MKCFALAICLCVVSGPALADSCATKAAEKKLAGAALKSFMTKCEKDAATACETEGKAKKLAGAAYNSFVQKCKKDAAQ